MPKNRADGFVFTSGTNRVLNGLDGSVCGPFIAIFTGVRGQPFSAVDAIVVILLAVAVAVVTWLIASFQGRTALMDGLFEQAPPIAMLNAEHVVVRVNREFTRLFGYEQSEAIGRPLSQLIVPLQSLEEFQRQLERAGQGHRADAEASRRRKDGSLLRVLAVVVPVTGPDGRLSIYILHRDITERKAAEMALEALSLRLMEVQESERRHLARELHDEIGGLLTGLGLLLAAGSGLPHQQLNVRLQQARGVVDDLLSRIRSLSFDLRPADLDQLGLLPALLALFERFTTQTGIQINFKHQGIDKRFASQIETGTYRIVQEGLTNVARHAGAACITVCIWIEMERLKLKIEDHGSGFDPEIVMKTRSNGLTGIRERTSLLGGRVSIESSPGCGTTIVAELPLEGKPAVGTVRGS